MNVPVTALPPKKRIFCNHCGNDTNHTCEADHHREITIGDETVSEVLTVGYRLWICAGCDMGTLEEYHFFREVGDEEPLDAKSSYYPERTKMHVKGKQFVQLPPKLASIYAETIGAFNNNLAVLCALGIRGLLEGICSDKKITGKTLKVKIDNMTSILPKNIVSNLHSMRFIGNEAAHTLAAPTTEDLTTAIEICEDLMNYLYELDYKASRLAQRTLTARKKTTVKQST